MPRRTRYRVRHRVLESRKKYFGIPIMAGVFKKGKFESITPKMKKGKTTRDYVIAEFNIVRFRRK
tara:strand:- start:1757 stop:1951 length:195 start_codon:yes stop_codon:yes gene_type:complete